MIKKFLGILFLVFLVNGHVFAEEEVLRCILKDQTDSTGKRSEVEINLDKKMLWLDSFQYKIFLVGDRMVKAGSDNADIQISIDRFDGFMTLKNGSSTTKGYCKKFNKIF